MGTLAINIEQVNPRRRNERVKRRSSKRTTKNKKKHFVLSKEDYKDFIKIKADKNYNNELKSTMFFFIGLSVTLFLMIIIFNWKFYDVNRNLSLDGQESAQFEEIQDTPLTQQPPPPPPAVIQQPVVIAVPDEVLIEEVEVNLDVEITEDMAIEEITFVDDELEEEVAEEIFQIVEVQPSPIGGYEAFYKYVADNLRYPYSAVRAGVEGRVFVRFVVNRHGEVDRAELLKGIHPFCDEEALRVVKNGPKWNPGRQRGRPVNVYMTLPITFKINK